MDTLLFLAQFLCLFMALNLSLTWVTRVAGMCFKFNTRPVTGYWVWLTSFFWAGFVMLSLLGAEQREKLLHQFRESPTGPGSHNPPPVGESPWLR